MKKILFVFGLFFSLGILLIRCKKDEVIPIDKTNDGSFKVFTEGNVTTVQNLSADTIVGIAQNGQPFGSGKVTFFSLENKVLVSNSDSATTNWDIGFRGTTIITNGGISGPGDGGAFVWTGSFSDLSSVPVDSTFRTDNGTLFAIPTGSNKGWYNYNGQVNLVTPLPGRVLVIRTAKGKYAKVEILNYYKKGVTPLPSDSDDAKLKNQRYYTFRYVFQPNGSKNF